MEAVAERHTHSLRKGLTHVSPTSAHFLAGAATATFVFAVAVSLRRSRWFRAERAHRFSARENHAWCLAWADVFEEIDDSAALECLLAARGWEEERTYEAVLREATCFDALGRLEEAFEAYAAAVVLAPRGEGGEALFSAALLAGQLCRPQEALTHLRLAMMGDPFLYEVVEALGESDEDPFRDIRRSPDFRALLREARRWANNASRSRSGA